MIIIVTTAWSKAFVHLMHHPSFFLSLSLVEIAPQKPHLYAGTIEGRSKRSPHPQHSVFHFRWRTKNKEGEHKLESHCVRSSFGVSQPVVLYFCDCNCLRWASCATTTRLCFIRLNDIWTGHRTLFAARCNHSPQIGLQTTTPIRASFGWSTFRRISWICLSRRCSHPKQNRS